MIHESISTNILTKQEEQEWSDKDLVRRGQSSLVDLSFKHRAVQVHNKVPASVRTGSLATVEKKLKKWVLQSVPID